MHTRYEDDGEPFETTDVIFEGVLAYHFVNDNFHTILFDIDETRVGHLVSEWKGLFDHGCKYGWPDPSFKSVEAAVSRFESNGAKAYHVSSSCGLYGWVIAESCRFETPPTGSTPPY